ncbi:hypothetical protein KCU88_g7019, partial [Aureobasidium melanogenum]
MTTQASSTVQVPRVAIKFCTQCKWNLRAAYYAQELLQTFSTSIGEVALIPVTGGIFAVTMTHALPQPQTQAQETEGNANSVADANANAEPEKGSTTVTITETVLWDRKTDGGFPETKELKNRVRNIIDPDRDLGHIDRSLKKKKNDQDQDQDQASRQEEVKDKSQPETVTVRSSLEQPGKEGNKNECEDCK